MILFIQNGFVSLFSFHCQLIICFRLVFERFAVTSQSCASSVKNKFIFQPYHLQKATIARSSAYLFVKSYNKCTKPSGGYVVFFFILKNIRADLDPVHLLMFFSPDISCIQIFIFSTEVRIYVINIVKGKSVNKKTVLYLESLTSF